MAVRFHDCGNKAFRERTQNNREHVRRTYKEVMPNCITSYLQNILKFLYTTRKTLQKFLRDHVPPHYMSLKVDLNQLLQQKQSQTIHLHNYYNHILFH